MALALPLSFVSCDVETDEEPGGTNIEKMAGRWETEVYTLDENGNPEAHVVSMNKMMTYNVAENNTTQMWLNDNEQFWKFTFKVSIDYVNRTFSCDETNYDAAGTGKAIVLNGKILEGAAKNLHGMPTDSIVFDIKFSDDDPAYGKTYRITGTRYSGFYE